LNTHPCIKLTVLQLTTSACVNKNLRFLHLDLSC
jgi:hypothetical protein